jgi:Cu2+-containing amine oxidase
MAGDSLPSYVSTPANVSSADIVAWYYGGVHHLVRDEDGQIVNGIWKGEAHIMWTGWMLKPHNLFDATPLLPTGNTEPPPLCPSGQRCCEMEGRRCRLCVPNNAQCP